MIFIRFLLFSIDTVNDFFDKNCHYIAGAISFYTLFALFPLFLAIIAVLSYLKPGPDDQVNLAVNIANVLPISSAFVSQEVANVVSTRAITGVASVVGLLWSATAVFSAIRKGVNAAWGVKKTRPYFTERLIDFALVLGSLITKAGPDAKRDAPAVTEATAETGTDAETKANDETDIGKAS